MEIGEIYLPKEIIFEILSFIKVESLREYHELYCVNRAFFKLMRDDRIYSKKLFRDDLSEVVNRFNFEKYMFVPLKLETVGEGLCLFNEYVRVRKSIDYEKRVFYSFKKPIELFSYLNIIMLNLVYLFFPMYTIYGVLTWQFYNIFLYFFYLLFFTCSFYYTLVSAFYLIVVFFHDTQSKLGKLRKKREVIRKCFGWKGLVEIMLSILQLYLFYAFYSLTIQVRKLLCKVSSEDVNVSDGIWLLKHVIPMILVILNHSGVKMKWNVFFLTFLYSCWIDKGFKYRQATNCLLNVYNIWFLTKQLAKVLIMVRNRMKSKVRESSSERKNKRMIERRIMEVSFYFILCGYVFGLGGIFIFLPLNSYLLFNFFKDNFACIREYVRKMIHVIKKKYKVDENEDDLKLLLNDNELMKKMNEDSTKYGAKDDGIGSYENFYLRMIKDCVESGKMKTQIRIFFWFYKPKDKNPLN